MSIKQTDIRLMEINAKLQKLSDKSKELLGEKTTLMFKLEHNEIHPILFMLKAQAIDFEAMLLQEETKLIEADYHTTKMVAEMGIDFAKEEF